MNYLKDNIIVLGCQRSGKTTLSNILVNNGKYSIISVDSLIYAFQRVYPETNIDRNSKIIEKSKTLTPFVAKYVESFRKDYSNVPCIIEACQLLPIDVMKEKLFCKNKIVCLGFPEASEDEIFENIRKNDINITSYTKKMSDYELKENIKYWIEYSKVLKKQAEKLGIPFYETNIDRQDVLTQIAEQLIKVKCIEEEERK